MSFALGSIRVGSDALAWGPLHDPATVTVDAPSGTVSTGGPNVTAEWTYAQPQGDPQGRYRVRVYDDSAVEQYDSGWLAGTASSWAIDWAEQGFPGVLTDWVIDVSVEGADSVFQATDTSLFSVDFGDPQLTITAPVDQSIHTDSDSLTVTWTVSDPGHTQAEYRVRLLAATTQEVLFSTGWVSSSDLSAVIGYLFADNTQVIVEVQAKNDQGMLSS